MKKIKWKLNSKYKTPLGLAAILLLLALTFSYAMFQGGFVSWFLFYSVLPFVLYTMSMVFYPLHNIQITRELSKDLLMAGEELTVTIRLKRKTPFPLVYLVIHDQIPGRLYKEALNGGEEDQIHSRALFFPLFKKNMYYQYQIKPVPRGVYHLNTVSLKTGDIFGFVHKEVNVSITDKVFIYPRYQEIERWEMDKHLQNGIQRAGKRSLTDYTSTVSVRDYAPGDRLSWLHWKASARSNKLLTKVFEHQRNDDYVIVLDQSAVSYKEQEWLFEKAVSFAASITHYSVQKGASIGLHSKQNRGQLSMNSGTDHEWRIMHELANVQADQEQTFQEWLKKEFVDGNLDGKTAVIISPQLEDYMMKTLEMIASRHANVVYFYMPSDNVLSSQETTLIHRLNNSLIPAAAISGPSFSEALKAGAKRASI